MSDWPFAHPFDHYSKYSAPFTSGESLTVEYEDALGLRDRARRLGELEVVASKAIARVFKLEDDLRDMRRARFLQPKGSRAEREERRVHSILYKRSGDVIPLPQRPTNGDAA